MPGPRMPIERTEFSMWYMHDGAKFCVGRSDWPNNVFSVLEVEDFWIVAGACRRMSITLKDRSAE
jgi:hypothetical protein